jgi:molybdopterin converting factor small subunit
MPASALGCTSRNDAMTQAPSVSIQIPGPLRPYCAGAAEVLVAAPNVRAALDQLERDHPSLYRNICDETGAVRRHIGVFVNTSHVRDREGLETVLLPGDVVTILPAVSGG